MVASLLVSGAAGLAAVGGAPAPAAAADLLELRLEALSLPIPLDQLEALSRGERPPAGAGGEELSVWLRLLRPQSQRDLLRLLRTPLLRDRTFGRQLLDSWAGSQMLAEVGGLLTTSDGRSTTPLLKSTLMGLLAEGQEVTAIDLLRRLPLSSDPIAAAAAVQLVAGRSHKRIRRAVAASAAALRGRINADRQRRFWS